MVGCSAVGPEHVHAVRMPSIFSSSHSSDDARALHQNLGCWDYEVPIEHELLVEELNRLYKTNRSSAAWSAVVFMMMYLTVADENIQARLRDVYLMHFLMPSAIPHRPGIRLNRLRVLHSFRYEFSYAPIKDL